MKIYLSGKLVDKQHAKISVFDHGLLYGDGIFEGIRAYNKKVFKLQEHIDRLYRSAHAIALKISMTNAEMVKAVVDTCRANEIVNGYIRLVVTRGEGTLGLNPFLCPNPEVIIIADAIQMYPQELYESGLSIVTVGTIRNIPEAINPRIKSLNYLNNILAKIEALNVGAMECVMLNSQGYVAEASGDNIFIIRGNELVTPPAWCGALEGITQTTVMQIAREMGYVVKTDVLSRYDLYTADEVFMTGTAAEVIPVVEIDHRTIGNGAPGVHTRRLEARFREYSSQNGVDIY